ncbi:MAG TPA: hypothetical protein VJ729_15750 [Nitrososphaeraceae archaeon]|nr:hypothetical protein [Nitrososphaeraceae archaeon]
MIENLLYVIIGFAITYLSLEVAWHFTACKIKDKEVSTLLVASQTRGGRVY